jgi:two-component system, cell cycle response regulator
MKSEKTNTEQTPPASEQAGGGRGSAYLIVIVGIRVGEMYRLAKNATVLGRGDDADVRLIDEGVSRRHAALVSDGDRVTLKDLGSVNGTYRNGIRIAGDVVLADGDKISMGGTTILKLTYQDHLDERFNRNLYESAVRDGLTGLYNRRYFDDRLRAELAFAKRHKTPLALMLADIDHFKKVNDERGHQIGDLTLSEVGRRLSAVMRAEDVIARYGGEEFAILCRNATESQARTLADRLRFVVAEELQVPDGLSLRITASLGLAVMPHGLIAGEVELVKAADAALYEAKRRGRDRSVVFGDLSSTPDLDRP